MASMTSRGGIQISGDTAHCLFAFAVTRLTFDSIARFVEVRHASVDSEVQYVRSFEVLLDRVRVGPD
jgi:hypothetical protein